MSWKNLQSFRITLFVLVAGLLLTACEWEPDIVFPSIPNYSNYGGYYGKVVNGNTLEPITDAQIICNNQVYESNTEGCYEIKASPEGYEITIKVSKEGYEDYMHTVSIKGEEAQELNIALTPVE